jgi:hypothetical protein
MRAEVANLAAVCSLKRSPGGEPCTHSRPRPGDVADGTPDLVAHLSHTSPQEKAPPLSGRGEVTWPRSEGDGAVQQKEMHPGRHIASPEVSRPRAWGRFRFCDEGFRKEKATHAEARQAKVLTKDETRRIAMKMARLPVLLEGVSRTETVPADGLQRRPSVGPGTVLQAYRLHVDVPSAVGLAGDAAIFGFRPSRMVG